MRVELNIHGRRRVGKTGLANIILDAIEQAYKSDGPFGDVLRKEALTVDVSEITPEHPAPTAERMQMLCTNEVQVKRTERRQCPASR